LQSHVARVKMFARPAGERGEFHESDHRCH
jgi:hypothetical protein